MLRSLMGAFVLIFTVSVFYGYEINQYPHKSRYDVYFDSVTDVNVIAEALNRGGATEDDRDYIYSALKRVGVLEITSLKPKVEEWVAIIPNSGTSKEKANNKDIFYMSILVLGKIGNETNGANLASFLHDVADPIGILCLMQALGDLTMSEDAFKALNEYTISVNSKTREDIVRQLVDSILLHNRKSSRSFLISMMNKVPLTEKSYVNEAIKQLGKIGKSDTAVVTNR